MFHKISAKRSRNNDDCPPGTKVKKIDQDDKIQFQLKPDDHTLSTISDQVIEFHTIPNQSTQSEKVIEQSGSNDNTQTKQVTKLEPVPDDSIQSEEVIEEQSLPDDSTLSEQITEVESNNLDCTSIVECVLSVPDDSTHSEHVNEEHSMPDDNFHSEQDVELSMSDDTAQSEQDINLSSELGGATELVVNNDINESVPNDSLQSFKVSKDTYTAVENQLDSNSADTFLNEEFNDSKSTKIKKPFSGWIANRHKLRFQEKWFTEFPFIDYDKKNNLMFCKACRKYVNDWRKTSPFVSGTDNFRASMLRYHQRSSMHTECQELADALTSQDSEAMGKDLYKDQLSHVFKSVYFIFKNKMPYTHYPQLCESQKREGTDFTVYTTHLKVVPLFGKFIGMAFEKELAQKIANVPEFSLVIDASFRRNIESHDLVYLKYLDTFMVQTVFLGVVDSSAKLHDSMYNILTALFKKYSIDRWVNKVVYIMTDKSDSHMWLEGLMDLIKTMSPQKFFSEVKYLSHKVKYCASVVQNHKVTSTFDALLWSIYCYYERVDKGKKNLINMNKELDEIVECYGSLPKNSYTTLYYEALKAVERDYGPLVRLLEAEQLLLHFDFKVRKSGARILSVITRGSFICKLALFIDIFACLNDFAIKLSSEDLLPYDVHILLDEVCADIEKAADGEGPTVTEIAEELTATPCYFRDIEILEDSNVHHILPEVKKFSLDVISYLKSLVDDSLLEKSFIFNVCLWPEDEEISAFGNSEFKDVFLKFNGKEKHVDSALEEWNLFKTKVLTLFPFEVRQNSKSVMMKMATEYINEFPFVTTVLRKILLLNFESSEIKRGYHEMCLNKSFSRSMLSLQSLQTAMMISMYGPSLTEFDFSLAMELFLNSRHRKFRKKIIDKTLTSSYISDQEENSIE